MSAPDMNRLEELLVDRAAHGLDEAQSAELQAALAEHPEVDAESYELAAAAVELVILEEAEQSELPAQLRARLDAAADAHATRAAEAARFLAPTAPAAETQQTRGGSGLAAWSGWMVAAAAMIVAILSFAMPDRGAPVAPPAALPVEEAATDPATLRAALIEEAPDVKTIAWAESAEGAAPGASGDVVWSDALQEGYMRFRNFAANDPSVEQYQLWIFDAERNDAHPVDGGVFDIPAGSDEVVVPIRAKLSVTRATLFAITVEKPGGVVVSSRERLPLVAPVES